MVQELFLINLEKENYCEITCFCLRADRGINPFPHDKILDQTELNAFADDKLTVTKMIIFVIDREENIVGKGEIAYISNFFPFPQCFSKGFFPTHIKRYHCVGIG